MLKWPKLSLKLKRLKREELNSLTEYKKELKEVKMTIYHNLMNLLTLNFALTTEMNLIYQLEDSGLNNQDPMLWQQS